MTPRPRPVQFPLQLDNALFRPCPQRPLLLQLADQVPVPRQQPRQPPPEHPTVGTTRVIRHAPFLIGRSSGSRELNGYVDYTEYYANSQLKSVPGDSWGAGVGGGVVLAA